MASQLILEKIKQSITSDKFVRLINLGYTGASTGSFIDDDYLRFDKDISLFMEKHYPSYTYQLKNDSTYNKWILLDNKNCICKDCNV